LVRHPADAAGLCEGIGAVGGGGGGTSRMTAPGP
jgi:hypothetical protein